MSSEVERGMNAYYARDPEALRRVLEQLAARRPEVAEPIAGPSGDSSHTGRNEREIGLGSGPGNS